jgi:cohesin loading factor subunit SCC2
LLDEPVIIPVLTHFLVCTVQAEERRIDSGQADAKMDADGNITVSKRISGDQNGDATLFGGVLTNHAERLFEMTHASNPTIRHSTLELIGLLLRQGLVNPNEAVPHLFALQGDIDNEIIRSLALRLLMTEGEKRPDTLRQRICAGVKLAYNFQRAVYPSKAQISAVVETKSGKTSEVHCIFGSVFEECIVKNRKQRLGLYKSLLGLFELDDYEGAARKSKAVSKDLSLLSFAAQILAHLPYNTAADPLYIVHHITSIITLQGLQTLDWLAEFLRPYGLSGSDEFDESNAEEDALEKAAQSKFPSRTQEARPLSSQDFKLAEFVDLVREGAALTLLLRLKSFLCASYNLTATRCMEYDPNTKERLCEKGIAKAKFSEPFDASVAAVLLQTKGAIDKDALVRQYAELRRRMRDESASEVRVSGSDDGEVVKSSPRKRLASDADSA